MSIWRRELEPSTGIHIYHCDEHGFKATDPLKVEGHLKSHGRSAAPFWTRKYHEEKKMTSFHCDDHNFRTFDPLEIEEHEKLHALGGTGNASGWGIV